MTLLNVRKDPVKFGTKQHSSISKTQTILFNFVALVLLLYLLFICVTIFYLFDTQICFRELAKLCLCESDVCLRLIVLFLSCQRYTVG